MKKTEYLRTMHHLVGQAKNLARQHGDDRQADALDEALAVVALDYEQARSFGDAALEETESRLAFAALPVEGQPEMFGSDWLESLSEEEARQLVKDSEFRGYSCRQCGRESPAHTKFCPQCGKALDDSDKTWM